MNDRILDTPQIDISAVFGRDVVGCQIQSISFEHRDIVKGKTHYGQPTIILGLINGKNIKFTHNFGELPDDEWQARFWIESR